MSITSDLKSYVDQTVATAQAQLSDVADAAAKYRENVGDIADKANEAVNDLRVSAEKAINLDAIKTAVEPYLSQAREYGTAVTDRAESLFNGVKDDPRLTRFVETANSVSSVVLEQVNAYVVKPVQSFTGFGAKPTKSAPRTAPKPATTKPANKPGTRRPSATGASTSKPAAKATARKATARTTAARTTTAAGTSTRTAAARKTTARKSTKA